MDSFKRVFLWYFMTLFFESMTMDIPVNELKAHFAHYLRLASKGETVVVTSHKKPLVQLAPVPAAPEGLPVVPGVRWNFDAVIYRGRKASELPKISGESLSDWILNNRR